MNIGINVTYRCNAVCQYCNRGVGQIKISDSDVSVDQGRMLADVMKDTIIHKIKVVGGEPTVHKQLYPLLVQLGRIKANLRQVHTNCKRLVPLPAGWSYRKSPLTSINDKDWHVPFLVSPRDAHVRSGTAWVPRRCSVMRHCGVGFDAWGFAMCSVAGFLGRLLKINPYRKTLVNRTMPEICSHCPYSLEKQEIRDLLDNAKRGGLPAVTDTFQKAMSDYKPMEFDRWSA